MRMKEGKLVLIGAGMVGSATLNAILAQSVVNEIVVIDANEDKALGEVLTLCTPPLLPIPPTPPSGWAATPTARMPPSS